MSTDTAVAGGHSRTSWRFVLLLGVAGVLVLRFVFKYVLPYLSLDPAYFGDSFWHRRYALLAHLTGGSLAIVAGLGQLWLGETRTHMDVHRRLGKVYLGGVAIGCAAGYYLCFTSPESWVYAFGLFGLATAWAVTTSMAYVSIRHRAISQHREWMIRSYVVTMAFVFFRLGDEILARFGIDPAERAKALAWMCWAVPLLVTEPLLQLRHARRARAGAVAGTPVKTSV